MNSWCVLSHAKLQLILNFILPWLTPCFWSLASLFNAKPHEIDSPGMKSIILVKFFKAFVWVIRLGLQILKQHDCRSSIYVVKGANLVCSFKTKTVKTKP